MGLVVHGVWVALWCRTHARECVCATSCGTSRVVPSNDRRTTAVPHRRVHPHKMSVPAECIDAREDGYEGGGEVGSPSDDDGGAATVMCSMVVVVKVWHRGVDHPCVAA